MTTEKTVATPSNLSMQGSATLNKIRDLRAGVERMRVRGTAYLPREERETEPAYLNRLSRSWLFPALDETVKSVANKVFARPVTLGDDVPPELEALEDNITNEGRNLNTFARSVFEDGVEAGVAFILVDGPKRGEEVVTAAEEKAVNFRPYLTHVKAEDVLGWKTTTILNETVLTQIRISEIVSEDDPEDEFGQLPVNQVRVLTVEETGFVGVRVYRQDDKQKWQIFDAFSTELREITIVPFYTNRTGFLQAEPVFEELADLNIAHWQSASDQRSILHKARVPILMITGMSVKEVTSSPNEAIVTANKDAKAGWVEHTGKAIEAGRDDLKDLEQRMQALGLVLVTPKPGTPTATGEALDAAKANTPLATMAQGLGDALSTAFGFMALYMGRTVEDGGTVNVNDDFEVMFGEQDSTFLLNARNTGQISHETFVAECKRRGILMESVDAADEKELLDAELPEPEDLVDVDLDEADEITPSDAFLKVVGGTNGD